MYNGIFHFYKIQLSNTLLLLYNIFKIAGDQWFIILGQIHTLYQRYTSIF